MLCSLVPVVMAEEEHNWQLDYMDGCDAYFICEHCEGTHYQYHYDSDSDGRCNGCDKRMIRVSVGNPVTVTSENEFEEILIIPEISVRGNHNLYDIADENDPNPVFEDCYYDPGDYNPYCYAFSGSAVLSLEKGCDHNYDYENGKYYEPSCIGGYTEYVCSVCGNKKRDYDGTDAVAPHTWTLESMKDCDAKLICSVCGDTTWRDHFDSDGDGRCDGCDVRMIRVSVGTPVTVTSENEYEAILIIPEISVRGNHNLYDIADENDPNPIFEDVYYYSGEYDYWYHSLYGSAVLSLEKGCDHNYDYAHGVYHEPSCTGGYTEYTCSLCGKKARDYDGTAAVAPHTWTLKSMEDCDAKLICSVCGDTTWRGHFDSDGDGRCDGCTDRMIRISAGEKITVTSENEGENILLIPEVSTEGYYSLFDITDKNDPKTIIDDCYFSLRDYTYYYRWISDSSVFSLVKGCDHNYDYAHGVYHEPSCTGGYTEYTCSLCGKKEREYDGTDAVAPHIWTLKSMKDCDAKLICSVCGETTSRYHFDSNGDGRCDGCGYRYLKLAPGASVTVSPYYEGEDVLIYCEPSDGVYNIYRQLSGEEKELYRTEGYDDYTYFYADLYSAANTFSMEKGCDHEFDYDNGEIHEATCAYGYTEYTCKLCGEKTKDYNTDPVAPHTWTLERTAECEAYYVCSVCGETTFRYHYDADGDGRCNGCNKRMIRVSAGNPVTVTSEHEDEEIIILLEFSEDGRYELYAETDKEDPETIFDDYYYFSGDDDYYFYSISGSAVLSLEKGCEHDYDYDHGVEHPVSCVYAYTEYSCKKCGKTTREYDYSTEPTLSHTFGTPVYLGNCEYKMTCSVCGRENHYSHSDNNNDGLCDTCGEMHIYKLTPGQTVTVEVSAFILIFAIPEEGKYSLVRERNGKTGYLFNNEICSVNESFNFYQESNSDKYTLLPACDHVFDKGTFHPATCIFAYTEYHCTKCDYSYIEYDESSAPVKGHDYQQTGKTDGCYAEMSCKLCGQTEWIRHYDNNKDGKCDNCGDCFFTLTPDAPVTITFNGKAEKLDAVPLQIFYPSHTEWKLIRKADGKEETIRTLHDSYYSIITMTCLGTTETVTYSLELSCEHTSYSLSKTVAATCVKDGYKLYTCDKCGKTRTETLKATGKHTPVTIPAVAATCTKTGLTAGKKCSVCNQVLTAQTTVATNAHTWNAGVVTTAATTEKTGVKTYTCTACKTTRTEVIPKLTENRTSYVLGDVNNDNKITSADARLALRRAINLENYKEGSNEFLACDVDFNNKVTSADARLILRAAVGLEHPETWKKA